MRDKVINKILTNKFNKWIGSFKDLVLRETVRKDSIITGGCITSLLLKEKPNDYDIYFTNQETAYLVARHYISLFREKNKDKAETMAVRKEDDRARIFIRSSGSASETSSREGYRYFEQLDPGSPESQQFVEDLMVAAKENKDEKNKEEYRPVFITSNAITLSNDIQLIFRFYGTPEEIHKNYDFIHCTNYWTPTDGLVLNKDALFSTISKELNYIGSRYPLSSLFRLRKFQSRGWHYNLGQVLKIAMQLNELDLKNESVLQDQLIGVDVFYFKELLERIKKDGIKDVDSIYISQLIDKIF